MISEYFERFSWYYGIFAILLYGLAYFIEIVLDIPLWNHECPGVAHVELKRLIQKIVDEVLNLPESLNLGGNHPPGRQQEEPLPYFDPKKYEELLATAVINKAINLFKNEKNVTENSSGIHTDSELDSNHNNKKELLTHQLTRNAANYFYSGESTPTSQPMSEFSLEKHDANVNYSSHNSQDYLNDYIQNHRVPLPEISSESNNDDDLQSVTSAGTDGTWEENWLFKKRKLKTDASVSIAMLVPSPTEDVKALIGDQNVDEVSDLSETESRNGDEEQLNSINGYSSLPAYSDSRLQPDSLISNHSLPEYEPLVTEAKNDLIFVGSRLTDLEPASAVRTMEDSETSSLTTNSGGENKYSEENNNIIETIELNVAATTTRVIETEPTTLSTESTGPQSDVDETNNNNNSTLVELNNVKNSVITTAELILAPPEEFQPIPAERTIIAQTEASEMASHTDSHNVETEKLDTGSEHEAIDNKIEVNIDSPANETTVVNFACTVDVVPATSMEPANNLPITTMMEDFIGVDPEVGLPAKLSLVIDNAVEAKNFLDPSPSEPMQRHSVCSVESAEEADEARKVKVFECGEQFCDDDSERMSRLAVRRLSFATRDLSEEEFYSIDSTSFEIDSVVQAGSLVETSEERAAAQGKVIESRENLIGHTSAIGNQIKPNDQTSDVPSTDVALEQAMELSYAEVLYSTAQGMLSEQELNLVNTMQDDSAEIISVNTSTTPDQRRTSFRRSDTVDTDSQSKLYETTDDEDTSTASSGDIASELEVLSEITESDNKGTGVTTSKMRRMSYAAKAESFTQTVNEASSFALETDTTEVEISENSTSKMSKTSDETGASKPVAEPVIETPATKETLVSDPVSEIPAIETTPEKTTATLPQISKTTAETNQSSSEKTIETLVKKPSKETFAIVSDSANKIPEKIASSVSETVSEKPVDTTLLASESVLLKPVAEKIAEPFARVSEVITENVTPVTKSVSQIQTAKTTEIITHVVEMVETESIASLTFAAENPEETIASVSEPEPKSPANEKSITIESASEAETENPAVSETISKISITDAVTKIINTESQNESSVTENSEAEKPADVITPVTKLVPGIPATDMTSEIITPILASAKEISTIGLSVATQADTEPIASLTSSETSATETEAPASPTIAAETAEIPDTIRSLAEPITVIVAIEKSAETLVPELKVVAEKPATTADLIKPVISLATETHAEEKIEAKTTEEVNKSLPDASITSQVSELMQKTPVTEAETSSTETILPALATATTKLTGTITSELEQLHEKSANIIDLVPKSVPKNPTETIVSEPVHGTPAKNITSVLEEMAEISTSDTISQVSKVVEEKNVEPMPTIPEQVTEATASEKRGETPQQESVVVTEEPSLSVSEPVTEIIDKNVTPVLSKVTETSEKTPLIEDVLEIPEVTNATVPEAMIDQPTEILATVSEPVTETVVHIKTPVLETIVDISVTENPTENISLVSEILSATSEKTTERVPEVMTGKVSETVATVSEPLTETSAIQGKSDKTVETIPSVSEPVIDIPAETTAPVLFVEEENGAETFVPIPKEVEEKYTETREPILKPETETPVGQKSEEIITTVSESATESILTEMPAEAFAPVEESMIENVVLLTELSTEKQVEAVPSKSEAASEQPRDESKTRTEASVIETSINTVAPESGPSSSGPVLSEEVKAEPETSAPVTSELVASGKGTNETPIIESPAAIQPESNPINDISIPISESVLSVLVPDKAAQATTILLEPVTEITEESIAIAPEPVIETFPTEILKETIVPVVEPVAECVALNLGPTTSTHAEGTATSHTSANETAVTVSPADETPERESTESEITVPSADNNKPGTEQVTDATTVILIGTETEKPISETTALMSALVSELGTESSAKEIPATVMNVIETNVFQITEQETKTPAIETLTGEDSSPATAKTAEVETTVFESPEKMVANVPKKLTDINAAITETIEVETIGTVTQAEIKLGILETDISATVIGTAVTTIPAVEIDATAVSTAEVGVDIIEDSIGIVATLQESVTEPVPTSESPATKTLSAEIQTPVNETTRKNVETVIEQVTDTTSTETFATPPISTPTNIENQFTETSVKNVAVEDSVPKSTEMEAPFPETRAIDDAVLLTNVLTTTVTTTESATTIINPEKDTAVAVPEPMTETTAEVSPTLEIAPKVEAVTENSSAETAATKAPLLESQALTETEVRTFALSSETYEVEKTITETPSENENFKADVSKTETATKIIDTEETIATEVENIVTETPVTTIVTVTELATEITVVEIVDTETMTLKTKTAKGATETLNTKAENLVAETTTSVEISLTETPTKEAAALVADTPSTIDLKSDTSAKLTPTEEAAVPVTKISTDIVRSVTLTPAEIVPNSEAETAETRILSTESTTTETIEAISTGSETSAMETTAIETSTADTTAAETVDFETAATETSPFITTMVETSTVSASDTSDIEASVTHREETSSIEDATPNTNETEIATLVSVTLAETVQITMEEPSEPESSSTGITALETATTESTDASEPVTQEPASPKESEAILPVPPVTDTIVTETILTDAIASASEITESETTTAKTKSIENIETSASEILTTEAKTIHNTQSIAAATDTKATSTTASGTEATETTATANSATETKSVEESDAKSPIIAPETLDTETTALKTTASTTIVSETSAADTATLDTVATIAAETTPTETKITATVTTAAKTPAAEKTDKEILETTEITTSEIAILDNTTSEITTSEMITSKNTTSEIAETSETIAETKPAEIIVSDTETTDIKTVDTAATDNIGAETTDTMVTKIEATKDSDIISCIPALETLDTKSSATETKASETTASETSATENITLDTDVSDTVTAEITTTETDTLASATYITASDTIPIGTESTEITETSEPEATATEITATKEFDIISSIQATETLDTKISATDTKASETTALETSATETITLGTEVTNTVTTEITPTETNTIASATDMTVSETIPAETESTEIKETSTPETIATQTTSAETTDTNKSAAISTATETTASGTIASVTSATETITLDNEVSDTITAEITDAIASATDITALETSAPKTAATEITATKESDMISSILASETLDTENSATETKASETTASETSATETITLGTEVSDTVTAEITPTETNTIASATDITVSESIPAETESTEITETSTPETIATETTSAETTDTNESASISTATETTASETVASVTSATETITLDNEVSDTVTAEITPTVSDTIASATDITASETSAPKTAATEITATKESDMISCVPASETLDTKSSATETKASETTASVTSATETITLGTEVSDTVTAEITPTETNTIASVTDITVSETIPAETESTEIIKTSAPETTATETYSAETTDTNKSDAISTAIGTIASEISSKETTIKDTEATDTLAAETTPTATETTAAKTTEKSEAIASETIESDTTESKATSSETSATESEVEKVAAPSAQTHIEDASASINETATEEFATAEAEITTSVIETAVEIVEPVTETAKIKSPASTNVATETSTIEAEPSDTLTQTESITENTVTALNIPETAQTPTTDTAETDTQVTPTETVVALDMKTSDVILTQEPVTRTCISQQIKSKTMAPETVPKIIIKFEEVEGGKETIFELLQEDLDEDVIDRTINTIYKRLSTTEPNVIENFVKEHLYSTLTLNSNNKVEPIPTDVKRVSSASTQLTTSIQDYKVHSSEHKNWYPTENKKVRIKITDHNLDTNITRYFGSSASNENDSSKRIKEIILTDPDNNIFDLPIETLDMVAIDRAIDSIYRRLTVTEPNIIEQFMKEQLYSTFASNTTSSVKEKASDTVTPIMAHLTTAAAESKVKVEEALVETTKTVTSEILVDAEVTTKASVEESVATEVLVTAEVSTVEEPVVSEISVEPETTVVETTIDNVEHLKISEEETSTGIEAEVETIVTQVASEAFATETVDLALQIHPVSNAVETRTSADTESKEIYVETKALFVELDTVKKNTAPEVSEEVINNIEASTDVVEPVSSVTSAEPTVNNFKAKSPVVEPVVTEIATGPKEIETLAPDEPRVQAISEEPTKIRAESATTVVEPVNSDLPVEPTVTNVEELLASEIATVTTVPVTLDVSLETVVETPEQVESVKVEESSEKISEPAKTKSAEEFNIGEESTGSKISAEPAKMSCTEVASTEPTVKQVEVSCSSEILTNTIVSNEKIEAPVVELAVAEAPIASEILVESIQTIVKTAITAVDSETTDILDGISVPVDKTEMSLEPTIVDAMDKKVETMISEILPEPTVTEETVAQILEPVHVEEPLASEILAEPAIMEIEVGAPALEPIPPVLASEPTIVDAGTEISIKSPITVEPTVAIDEAEIQIELPITVEAVASFVERKVDEILAEAVTVVEAIVPITTIEVGTLADDNMDLETLAEETVTNVKSELPVVEPEPIDSVTSVILAETAVIAAEHIKEPVHVDNPVTLEISAIEVGAPAVETEASFDSPTAVEFMTPVLEPKFEDPEASEKLAETVVEAIFEATKPVESPIASEILVEAAKAIIDTEKLVAEPLTAEDSKVSDAEEPIKVENPAKTETESEAAEQTRPIQPADTSLDNTIVEAVISTIPLESVQSEVTSSEAEAFTEKVSSIETVSKTEVAVSSTIETSTAQVVPAPPVATETSTSTFVSKAQIDLNTKPKQLSSPSASRKNSVTFTNRVPSSLLDENESVPVKPAPRRSIPGTHHKIPHETLRKSLSSDVGSTTAIPQYVRTECVYPFWQGSRKSISQRVDEFIHGKAQDEEPVSHCDDPMLPNEPSTPPPDVKQAPVPTPAPPEDRQVVEPDVMTAEEEEILRQQFLRLERRLSSVRTSTAQAVLSQSSSEESSLTVMEPGRRKSDALRQYVNQVVQAEVDLILDRAEQKAIEFIAESMISQHISPRSSFSLSPSKSREASPLRSPRHSISSSKSSLTENIKNPQSNQATEPASTITRTQTQNAPPTTPSPTHARYQSPIFQSLLPKTPGPQPIKMSMSIPDDGSLNSLLQMAQIISAPTAQTNNTTNNENNHNDANNNESDLVYMKVRHTPTPDDINNANQTATAEDEEVVHLIPGSIAEREHLKWQNAEPMANNPYSSEALQRRLICGNTKPMDIHLVLDDNNQGSDPQGEDKENKTLQTAFSEDLTDYTRYGRDYYINDAKKASGTRKSMNDLKTFMDNDLTSDTDAANNVEVEQPAPAQKTQQEPPITATILPRSKTNNGATFLARPVQISDDSTVASPEDTNPQSMSPRPGSLTISEDSDTTRIYDLNTGETKIVHDNRRRSSLEQTAATPPTTPVASQSDSIESPIHNQMRKAVSEETLKFFSPKRPPKYTSNQKKFEEHHENIVKSFRRHSLDRGSNEVTEKLVIEKEVIEALPSVKDLAKIYIHNDEQEAPLPKAKPKTFIVKENENDTPTEPKRTDVGKINMKAVAKNYDAGPTHKFKAGHSITARSISRSMREELKNTPTEPTISENEKTEKIEKPEKRHTSPERPPSPVLKPGNLRNSIAFFENLK